MLHETYELVSLRATSDGYEIINSLGTWFGKPNKDQVLLRIKNAYGKAIPHSVAKQIVSRIKTSVEYTKTIDKDILTIADKAALGYKENTFVLFRYTRVTE